MGCSRVELMEANIYGFKVAGFPCEFGSCTAGAVSKYADVDSYGPGSSYTIDSLLPFKVNTKFIAFDNEGEPGDLMRIETCLIQGANEYTLTMDDPDYLSAIQDKLQYRMPVVMANFNAGSDNDLSGECASTSTTEGNAVISSMRWTSKDALEEENTNNDDGELVIGDVAESIDKCGEDSCSACHKAHWSNAPTTEFYTCTDNTQYKYSNKCTGNQNSDKCGEDDLCFRAWPHDDPNKWKSDDFACRPLPMRLQIGDFKYARRQCRSNKGLCAFGCGDGTCHNSWPIDDADRWKSADAMCRCKN